MGKHASMPTARLAGALFTVFVAVIACMLALAPGRALADESLSTQAGGTLSAEDFTISYVTFDADYNEIISSSEPSIVFKGDDIKPGWDFEVRATFAGDPDAEVGVDYVQMPDDMLNVGHKSFAVRVSLPYEEGYTGQSVTVNCGYTIEPRDVADGSVELWNEPPIYPYNVSASDISWDAQLVFNIYDLVQGTDFDVEVPSNLVEGADANKFTVKGKGNFTGSFQKSFSIGWDLDSDLADLIVYGHGDEHHPILTATETSQYLDDPFLLGFLVHVEFAGEAVSEDDYDVSMTPPDDNGEGTITVTAKQGGSVKGTRSIPYTALMGAVEVSNANTEIELFCNSYLYTGNAIEPQITGVYVTPTSSAEPVNAKFAFLGEGEITYSNNIEVGTGTVSISMDTEEYKGTVTKSFKIIDPATLNASAWEVGYASVSAKANYEFDTAGGTSYYVIPKGQLPQVEATLWEKTDEVGAHENEIFVSSDSIEVTGVHDSADMGAFGVKSCDIKIKGTDITRQDACSFLYSELGPDPSDDPTVDPADNPIDLKSAVVTAAGQTYTGKALKPAVSVVLNGQKLNAATDYDVAYKNNTNAGKAIVTITGKGNYTGTATGSFTIAKAGNTFKLANVKRTVKYKKLKKKKQSVAGATVAAQAQGGVTYSIQSVAKAKFKKKFSINKTTGKITVKKGTKKGAYKVTVKAIAAGNANYNGITKTAIVTIKVK